MCLERMRKGEISVSSNFMGYTINNDVPYFLPNTVLIHDERVRITVSMAKDAIDYILGLIALKNPLVDDYKKAKNVFSAMKSIFENKQPPRIKKEDKKIAVNVLLEIKNQSAKSQAEKEYNEKCALLCKWLIDEFHQPK